MDYTEIQSIIGYKFQNQDLLATALQHASVNSTLYNYERLEFLGDSILNAIVSEWLYDNNPDQNEGYLTKQKLLTSVIVFVNLLETNRILKLLFE